MSQSDRLVAKVVDAEWTMFQSVPNVGGKASCQENPQTFRIMRASQLASWSDALLESYLGDLQDAQAAGRNLLTEKYARMMATTWPAEYARIEHLLPAVDPAAFELIDRIAAVVLAWEAELAEKYPRVMKRGRPLTSKEDRRGVTSMETYLQGELATYSVRTLERYLEHVMRQQAQGINGSELTLLHTTRQYGYESLQQANERL